MAAPPCERISAAIRKIDWLLPPMASEAAPTHPIFRGCGRGEEDPSTSASVDGTKSLSGAAVEMLLLRGLIVLSCRLGIVSAARRQRADTCCRLDLVLPAGSRDSVPSVPRGGTGVVLLLVSTHFRDVLRRALVSGG